jgi:hypothetical protein
METASNFVMYEPDNGKPISRRQKNRSKGLYNNDAIYISALLCDNEPHKIQEITNRDVFEYPDHFQFHQRF